MFTNLVKDSVNMIMLMALITNYEQCQMNQTKCNLKGFQQTDKNKTS